MRKFLFGFATLALLVFITSCGSSNIDVSDAQSMKAFGEKVMQKLESGAIVSYIEFEKNQNQELRLTTKFANLIIKYRDSENKSKTLTYNIAKGKVDVKDSKIPFINGHGREISAQDFVNMSNNVNKAIQEQKNNNIEIIGIGLYKINISKTPQSEISTFRLYEEDKSKKKNLHATYYIEYSCSMDGEGNIKSLRLGW